MPNSFDSFLFTLLWAYFGKGQTNGPGGVRNSSSQENSKWQKNFS